MIIKNKKGQVGVEAMIIIGILFVIFLIVFLYYNELNAKIFDNEKILNERNDCLELSNNINNLYILGEGTEITIKLDTNYTIDPSSKTINSLHSTCTIMFNNLSPNLNPNSEPFTIGPGDIKLSYKNGIITLTNA